MDEHRRRHLTFASLLLLALTLVGTLAFQLAEQHLTLLEAFYTSVVTITTVGMHERPVSPAGQGVAVGLILCSFGILSYLSFTIGAALLEGRPQAWIRERKVNRMNQHVIVCGYGRMGAQVASEIAEAGVPRCVIEMQKGRLELAETAGHGAVLGDATTDETLIQAGVKRARALVAVLDSDPKNVYLALTARDLNPEIQVVSVAYDSEGEIQLRRVGVDRIVSLRKLGSHRLSNAVLRPSVVEFIELASRAHDLSFEIDEAPIRSPSRLIGSTLKGSGIRERSGALVVAIERHGAMLFNPAGEEVFRDGDTLVLMGSREQIDAFGREFGT